MAIRTTSWKVKSKDDKVTVKVQVSRRGKETGNARYIYADGREETKSYKPRKSRKRSFKPNPYLLAADGVLSGILLEAATHILKLR